MLANVPDRDAVDAWEAVVLNALTGEDRAAHAVYSGGEVHPGGRTVEVSGLALSATADFLVAFVDESPGGNWAHACRYLVATRAGVERSAEAGWPPVVGRLPPPWRLLHRGRSVEEWQLLPLATAPTVR